MMSLKVKINGKTYQVKWDNGKLSGDEIAVTMLEIEARLRDGELVGPPLGPYTEKDHLSSPASVLALAESVFDEIISVGGDEPNLPPEILEP